MIELPYMRVGVLLLHPLRTPVLQSMMSLNIQGRQSREELLQQILTLQKDSPALLQRNFVPTVDAKPDGECVRVMQWNILAQALSSGADNFVRCPREALQLEPRRLQILQEILQYGSDIVCLEEVDQYSFLDSALSSIGYEGTFFKKLDSPCLYVPGKNYGPDGCAMFFNSAKIQSLASHSINLKHGRKVYNHVVILQKFKVLKKENGVNSQSQNALPIFWVAVTHLKAKSGNDEQRHRQGQYILQKVKEICGSELVIICGDFNASKDEPVYQEFANSDIGLTSTYTRLNKNNQEPEYTTWKVRGDKKDRNKETEVCRTIDYIWYSTDKVAVNQVLAMPTSEQIGEGRLPSLSYPSDHLSLIGDFSFM